MTQPEQIQVRVTRRFSASAERVFDAWLDVDKARTFFFATSEGDMVRAEIDARVGGSFTFVDRRDGTDVVHRGTYVEIERPRRLAFDFAVDDSPSSRVTIDIAPSGSGCELTLTHAMDRAWEAYRDRTTAGWIHMLAGEARALGEG
jgi:uncharacterized protein YndB with AHSA1/START domain